MSVNRSLITPTSNALLEQALRRKAQAPQRGHGQPGRTRAAGHAPRPDPEHAQAALPRAAAGALFASDHGLAVDGIGDPSRSTAKLVNGLLTSQLPVSVFARDPGARAFRRRLRRRRGGGAARPPAGPQDRPRHTQRPRHFCNVARAGARRHPRRHGDRRRPARQCRRLCAGIGVGAQREFAALVLSRLSDAPLLELLTSGPSMKPDELNRSLAVLQAAQDAPQGGHRPGRGAGGLRRLRDRDDGRRDARGRQQAPPDRCRRHARPAPR